MEFPRRTCGLTTVRIWIDMVRALISTCGKNLPVSTYQAGKAGKAGILETTTHARARIASPHDTHAKPDMQVSCRGLRGEQLIFEFEL